MGWGVGPGKIGGPAKSTRCPQHESRPGVIGSSYKGVDKELIGKGLASEMVQFVIEHAPSHINAISAGTQKINQASIALYEALSFVPKKHQLTFHKHGAELD